MYKYQLKKTGLSKNLKGSEALAMARVKAWRDARGITSEFWRRGKLVEPGKLQKFVRLHRREFKRMIAEDEERTEPIEALLPPHVVVLAPSAPSGAVAAKLDITEKMLMGFRDYIASNKSSSRMLPPSLSTLPESSSSALSVPYQSGQETSEIHVLWWELEINSKHSLPAFHIVALPSQSMEARHCFADWSLLVVYLVCRRCLLIVRLAVHKGIETLKHDAVAGGRFLQSAFSLVHPIISKGGYWPLIPLLSRLTPLHDTFSWASRAPEVARVLFDYIAQVSLIQHGPDHPYTLIFQGFIKNLYRADQQTCLSVMDMFWGIVCENLEARGDNTGIEYTLAYAWHVNASAALAEPDPARRLPMLEAVWRSRYEQLRTDDTGARAALQAYFVELELVHKMAAQGRVKESLSFFEAIMSGAHASIRGPVKWLGYTKFAAMTEKAGDIPKTYALRRKADECRIPLNKLETCATRDDDTLVVDLSCGLGAPRGEM